MNLYMVVIQNYTMSIPQEVKGTELSTDKVGNILIKNDGKVVAIFPVGTIVYKKEV